MKFLKPQGISQIKKKIKTLLRRKIFFTYSCVSIGMSFFKLRIAIASNLLILFFF